MAHRPHTWRRSLALMTAPWYVKPLIIIRIFNPHRRTSCRLITSWRLFVSRSHAGEGEGGGLETPSTDIKPATLPLREGGSTGARPTFDTYLAVDSISDTRDKFLPSAPSLYKAKNILDVQDMPVITEYGLNGATAFHRPWSSSCVGFLKKLCSGYARVMFNTAYPTHFFIYDNYLSICLWSKLARFFIVFVLILFSLNPYIFIAVSLYLFVSFH